MPFFLKGKTRVCVKFVVPTPSHHMKDNYLVSKDCILIKLFTLIICALSATVVSAQEVAQLAPEEIIEEPLPTLENLLPKLISGSLSEKVGLIKQITGLEDERKRSVLEALARGRLFYAKDETQRVYIAEKIASGYRVTDPLSSEQVGEVSKRSVKKIRVNNRLRKLLRTSLAQLDMQSADSAVRLNAVNNLAKDLNEQTIAGLRAALSVEADDGVSSLIQTILAKVDLYDADANVRLDAVQKLSETMSIEYKTELDKLLKKDSAGKFVEKNQKIISAAKSAIAKIESRISLYENMQTLFFGLSLGSVLVLAAIGLAITFGVMGVINMAHGELIMLGAYTTYVVQLLMPEHIDISLFIAVPAAFIVSGLFGILIERGVIRFLYGRPLETLLATFGISLVLQQLVRSVFTPLNRSVSTPSWMSGSVEINSVLSLTLNRCYIIGFTLLVFFILLAILKKTRLGLEVRAVSQNRAMAKAMGIKTEKVDAMTFGLGSGIAGVAGVALSQLTNVGPNLGQSYIIDSFMVVVFGGVGNLWGTMISGITLGVANKFIEPFAGAVLAKILVLVFIIIFIQKRPRGLFPQKGRAAEG